MKRTHWIAVLAVLALVAVQGDVRGETPPPPPKRLHCGPVSPGVADSLVLLNVANVSALSEPAQVHLQLLDTEGATLAERRLVLGPGQSRALPLRIREPRVLDLVRGVVNVTDGPDDLELTGTLQVFLPALGLTNGPNFRCSGDVGPKEPG